MADARVRIRINGTAEAATGTEYTKYLFKCMMTDVLNKPSEFDITLLGSSNTSDIAVGNVIELYWGTSMSVGNRFFKGKIKKVEEETAKKLRITGKGAGWAQLIDRKHNLKAEWGDESRWAEDPVVPPQASVTRSELIDYLITRDLDGASTNLVEKGTITSSSTNVPFFDTQFESRLTPFIRCAELWGTDIWFDQDGSGNDRINLTTKGSDKTGSAIFYLSGANKNAKVGSNLMDERGQFTQVTVIGSGDGYGQISGQWPLSGYTPASPEKEMIVIRPELKTATDCAALAQTIHGRVSQPVRRIRFKPDVPGTWLTSIYVGDTIRISSSNLANLPTPFDTRIFELTFNMDFEGGVFELVLQTENRRSLPFDSQADTNHAAIQASSSAVLENRVLNLLRDINTDSRLTQWSGGLLARKVWLTLGGTTEPASTLFEDEYPLILDPDTDRFTGAPDFSGHILFRTGVTADPITAGVQEGALYYNSLTHGFRFHNGDAWGDLGGGSPGSTYWERVTGTPNYLRPLTVDDHVLPNGTANLGSSGTPWTAVYGTTLYCTYVGNNLIPSSSSYNLGQLASPTWNNLYLAGGVNALGTSTFDGDAIFNENVTLGNSSADDIEVNGRFISHLIPDTNSYNLGQSGSPTWNNLYLVGGVTALSPSTMDDISCVDLSASGSVTLGDTSTDIITVNGRFNTHLIPTGSTYNLGQLASPTWNNLYLGGGVTALGTSSFAGATFSGAVTFSSSVTANSTVTMNGDVVLGNSSADNITIGGRIVGNLIPDTNSYNLGQPASPTWNNLYLVGDISCDDITADNINYNSTTNTSVVSNLNADRCDSRDVSGGSTGILAADLNNLNLSNLWHIEPQSSSNSAQLGSSGYRFNEGYFDAVIKNSSTFQIDHPDDPQSKWLIHSIIEGPERTLIYKGRATLQGKKATITMPPYFHSLCGEDDIEYNLTPIGHPSQLYIAKEMKRGVFEVGGTEDCEFSWIVYSVRKDRWAVSNPLIVEKMKDTTEKGRYLKPALYEDIDPGCTKRQQDLEKKEKGEANG